jgi:hypothetical protein
MLERPDAFEKVLAGFFKRILEPCKKTGCLERSVRRIVSIFQINSINAMETKYLIWSIEYEAWWRKKSWGYTKNIKEAELYSRADAKYITNTRNGFINPPNVEMIAESDQEKIKEKVVITSMERIKNS